MSDMEAPETGRGKRARTSFRGERRRLLAVAAWLLPVAGRLVPHSAAGGAERLVAHLGIALSVLLWCLSGVIAGRLFVRGSRRLAGTACLLVAIAGLRFAADTRLPVFVSSLDVLIVASGFLAATQVFGSVEDLRGLARAAGLGTLFCLMWASLEKDSAAAGWLAISQLPVLALVIKITAVPREAADSWMAALGPTAAAILLLAYHLEPVSATPAQAALPAILMGATASYGLGRAGFELGPGTSRSLGACAGSLVLGVMLMQGSWILGQWHASRARALATGPGEFALPLQDRLARGYLVIAPEADPRDFGLMSVLDPGPVEDPVALKNAVLDQPFRPDLRERLALGLLAAGQEDQARALFSQALELDARRALSWAYLGKLAQESGALDEARRILETGVTYVPDDARLLNELGLVCRAAGPEADALRAFERAVLHPPVPAEVWFNLGVQRERAGLKPEAIQAFTHFLDLWKGDGSVRDGVRKRLEKLRADPPVTGGHAP